MSEGVPKKPGNRQPSPRLHRITQKWSAEEWRQFVAFARIFGSGSHQLRLLEFLRAMTGGYDPESERKEFKGQNLTSLRYHAVKYSYTTGRRLDFIHQYDLVMMHGNIQLAIQKSSFDDASEFLGKALQMAYAWEDFHLTAMFLLQERIIITATMVGSARTSALQENASHCHRNAIHLNLENEVVQAWAILVEPLRNLFVETGKVDHAGIHAFFNSDFYLKPMEAFPSSLQIERHRMEQLIQYLLGEYLAASKAAEAILSIYDRNKALQRRSPDGHSQAILNLATYYSELGMAAKAKQCIGRFETVDPCREEKRDYYLRDYLFLLFQLAIDQPEQSITAKAIQVWEQNQAFLESKPLDMLLSRLLLAVASFYLAAREIDKANALIKNLCRINASFSAPTTQAMFMLMRVILLLEEQDHRGLGSIGLSIERKLLAHSANTNPALEVVRLLKRKGNLDHNGTLNESLEMILEVLRKYSTDENYKRALWYPQLIQWVTAKMAN